ncbi:MAG: glycosyltransferase family 39 protein [Gammaproteobacteria bacterium]|nr:glycosyltransferase family 39 protein [Gammaproteobacteria bacterium]
MMSYSRSIFLLLFAWFLLVLTALLVRPLLPVDETRYLTVAWEMWSRGDFLVPYLNGEAYSHKPPLLFWLFQLGWTIFGVNEWWPRLVAPLLALGCLFLTMRIFSVLWPQYRPLSPLAAWFLLGTGLWTLFLTLTQFDLLIVFATLLAMRALLAMREHKRAWWLLGLALGLGLLSKGPVILLHTLPVALLAPLWLDESVDRARWYKGVGLAILMGAAMVLLWAIPAAEAGGEVYKKAIFWGQTADRMVNSFAHRQPWWWYLPMLPLILLPWSLWPRLWQLALRLRSRLWQDQGVRFLLYWLVPVFIAFSLISGKQVKYLLPLFPAIALLAVRVLAQDEVTKRVRLWLPGIGLGLSGLLLLVLPFVVRPEWADWLQQVSPLWGGLLLALAALQMVLPAQNWQRSVLFTALSSILLAIVLHLSVINAGAMAYSLKKPAEIISLLQIQGHPVANSGKYHGQFHFLGRLQQPLAVIAKGEGLSWIKANPSGYVVVYYRQWSDQLEAARYAQVYRSGALAIWSAQAVLEQPQRLDRTLGE